MILNVTLKMIVRSWWRNKVFFLVSVASLALGLACTNLLMTYFVHEHGLEGRNPDRDRIVFLQQDDPMNEGKRVAYAAAEIPQRLKNSYAEVEDYLRMGTLHLLSCKKQLHRSLDRHDADPFLRLPYGGRKPEAGTPPAEQSGFERSLCPQALRKRGGRGAAHRGTDGRRGQADVRSGGGAQGT